MGKLTKRGRSRISAKNFVFPKGTKASKGEPKFPIHNRAHARSALSRAAQKRTKLTKTERCKVVQKVCDKFPTVGLCKTNTVPKKSVFAKCNGVAVAGKGPKGTIRGTFRTYKDAQGYTVNQWSAPPLKKKAAPRKKGPSTKKRRESSAKWKKDPRGGVSRVVRYRDGSTHEEWMPLGPPSKVKTKLYLYKPSKNPREGVALIATSMIDAQKKLISHCRTMGYKSCDLSKLHRATKREEQIQASGYWD